MIDSSPPSAESSFRELDEVFLQTQTRIWLGELLSIRLDEDLPLSDLLQDGEILFEVSKVVWDFLWTKCMELRHMKHKYGPFRSKKSSGRYRPYSNVDSFLKVCKILGLSGIDLFSPSDVVEKRDIRKVCICIRALSKKARSKQLSVPDFDMVMYSVTMPTDMVGVIRRSLETPQCTFSSSSSYGSRKGSQTKLKKKKLYALSNRDDDSSSSEESDEAESRYMGENSFLSNSKLEDADGTNSDLENSPKTNRGASHVNNEERHNRKNDNVDVSVENDDSFMGDSSNIDVGEKNYISDYLAFSDLMVHATDDTGSVVRDGEKNMFDFFLNVDSQRSSSGFHNGSQRVYSDDEDMEVSSTTSMSSVLGRMLNLELDNQFDEDDSLSTNVGSSTEHDSQKQYKDLFVVSNADTSDEQPHAPEHFLSAQDKCQISGMENPEGESHDFCPENKSVVAANDNNERPLLREDKEKQIHTLGSDSIQTNPCESMAENHHCSTVQSTHISQEDSRVAGSQVQDKQEGSEAESTSNGNKDTPPPRKYNRRPLLKTVVKGTAIAGVLLLLVHINNGRGGNNAQESSANGEVTEHNRRKQQTRRAGNGIYPTEKIKLGN